MRQKRPERMEAAGSLTPDLEGAVRSSPHQPRGSGGQPAPKQEESSGGSTS